MNGKTQKRWLQGLLSAVLLGLNIPSATLAQTADAPPPGSVSIQSFSYGGSGCPQGSVGSMITPDQTQIELLFDKFAAELDTKKTTFGSQANCSVSFELKYPSGWSVSWDRVEQSGSVNLSGGAQGQIRSRFYIPGNGGFDVTRIYDFPANDVEDYTVLQNSISDVFTQCGAQVPLDVNTQVRVYGTPTGYNTVTIVANILHLTWRPC
jgi:hypothetical protein